MRLSSRRGLAACAVASALLLSACTQNAPGVAADVAGSEITDQEVDDFARVLCGLNVSPDGAEGTGAPSRPVRARALELLLGIAVAEQIVDVDDARQADVAEAVRQAAPSREQLPEDLREVFDDAVRDFARTQLALTELGRRSLAEQGQADAGEEAAFAEGERLRAEYVRDADITIDPRFGELKDGAFVPASGSLSVPVSDLATGGAAAEPSPDLLESLPVSQTCA